jgi:predicted adenine nucleotide alpha hydrolase (AANH) superfamily ATPase
MDKILLHTCCAPCLIYPLERLRESGFLVSGYFYNPNIHPFSEYINRKNAVESLDSGVAIDFPEYKPQDFFQAINGFEVFPGRCAICWELRLKKTALAAKEKGFTYFTTTLLVSPYQDQELLKRIGDNVAKETGVDFYYEDFRPGFRKAHDEAKAKGIYCQKYCGCIYSEIERCKKSEKR